jgi:hypothetical protein
MKNLNDIDRDKLKAALEKLEAEKKSRLAIKNNPDQYIPFEGRDGVVHYIKTGVPRPTKEEREQYEREIAARKASLGDQPVSIMDSTTSDPSTIASPVLRRKRPDQPAKYFYISLGEWEIVEGTYSVEDGRVIVRDTGAGKILGSEALSPDDVPDVVARQLLRKSRDGFNRRLTDADYPKPLAAADPGG